ncbi:MAG: hypothetical protein GQ477_02910 [Nanohaloarchaea archaeon]|nr:hypothetical protein [Candidatus Nanohaloarchaea archaeon]
MPKNTESPTLEEFMEYIMDNCKTESQIETDLFEGKCTIHSYKQKVNPNTPYNIDDVKVTYKSGLTFYREGDTFNSSDLIGYQSMIQQIKDRIKTEKNPEIIALNKLLLSAYMPCS